MGRVFLMVTLFLITCGSIGVTGLFYQENEKLRGQIESANKSREASAILAKEANDELTEIKTKLESAEKSAKDMEAQLASLTSAKAEAEKVVKATEDKLKAAEDQLGSAEKQLSEAQSKVEDSAQKLSEALKAKEAAEEALAAEKAKAPTQ